VILPLLLLLAQPPRSADERAFTEANRTVDPQARIEALETFITRYPGSRLTGQARRAVIHATAERWPKDQAKLRDAADRMLKNIPRDGRAALWIASAEAFAGQGFSDDAVRFARRGLAAQPDSFTAALLLADDAARRRDPERELAYLAQARLASPRVAERWEKAWRTQRGSHQGREEYLDHLYKRLHPAPRNQPIRRPPVTGRLVLVELYTGAGCPPCAGADVAYERILAKYSREQLAFLAFHQNAPRPDPMANADSTARLLPNWGVPAHVIDGVPADLGGGSRAEAPAIESAIARRLDQRLQVPPDASLRLQVRRQGSGAVAAVDTDAAPDTRLTVVLVEEEVRYSGENGVRFHPMVARAVRVLDPGVREVQFELPNQGRFSIAAFAQNPRTSAVLQAAFARLGIE
jgi:hypothetical protein